MKITYPDWYTSQPLNAIARVQARADTPKLRAMCVWIALAENHLICCHLDNWTRAWHREFSGAQPRARGMGMVSVIWNPTALILMGDWCESVKCDVNQ